MNLDQFDDAMLDRLAELEDADPYPTILELYAAAVNQWPQLTFSQFTLAAVALAERTVNACRAGWTP